MQEVLLTGRLPHQRQLTAQAADKLTHHRQLTIRPAGVIPQAAQQQRTHAQMHLCWTAARAVPR